MQKFSLTAKLALVLSALSLVLILTILMVIKTSFDKGFDRYINRSIAVRMDALAEHLVDNAGALPELIENRRNWERYLRGYYRQLAGDQEAGNEPAPEARSGKEGDLMTGGRRYVWLLDGEAKSAMSGPIPPLEALKTRPVAVGNEVVAHIAWRPVKARDNALDALFAAHQHRLFAWIAFFAVLLSCALAWPLSRFLVNPVRRLSRAMHALMQRDYSQRVVIGSRDEIGMLASDFNLMAQTLEEHDSQQRQWLADISHELRTPLGVLKGELEAIEDGVLSLDDSRVRSLSEEVNQLARLVDDLHQLAVTQMSHLRYRFERLDLAAFMQQLSYRLAPMMQQAGLTWQLETDTGPLWIRADSQRLEQLVMNLAQNSIRYTTAGGRVKVRLSGAESVSLVWEDSEPGISNEELQHLFDRFYRVEHSRQRSLGGSGLGLFIVANIAEAHGVKPRAAASTMGGLQLTFLFDKVD